MGTGFSSFKGSVSFAAVLMLMGAKTNGCGPDLGDDGDTGTGGGPTVVCPDGTVFDGEQCVWVDPPVCPEGMIEQTVCADAEPAYDAAPEMGGSDAGVAEPSQCWTECVSVDPTCPPGMHEETYCEPSCDGDMGTCSTQCVPDSFCPPDTYSEWICDEMGCWEQCTPIDPVCPPDSYPEMVCDENGNCYTQCTPIDPICPDGTYLTYECDPNGVCYEVCVPIDQPCPPGEHLEVQCTDPADPNDPMTGVCTEVCVPDDPYGCPPGTHYEEGCDGDVCWAGCVEDQPQPCPPGTYPDESCDPNGFCTTICIDMNGEPPQPGTP